MAKDLLLDGTYGPTGGSKKTLKSWVEMFIAVGVASGKPIFGTFDVPEAKPVLLYAGEGGRLAYKHRLVRVAHAYGVNPAVLPVETNFGTAPLNSDHFVEVLQRDLDEVQPGYVVIDPLYMFHGARTNASSLYERGDLLAPITRRVLDAGATLKIVDH